MAYLVQFSPVERALIIALPYRVGYYISVLDDTGGHVASSEEINTLDKVISHTARGMFKTAFIHEVMVETHRLRPEWRKWGADIDRVPQECRTAMNILRKHFAERDVKAYADTLLEISVNVARSFNEDDINRHPISQFISDLVYCFNKFVGKLLRRDFASILTRNISIREDVGLLRITEALGIEIKSEEF
jgi:hypothetical protein